MKWDPDRKRPPSEESITECSSANRRSNTEMLVEAFHRGVVFSAEIMPDGSGCLLPIAGLSKKLQLVRDPRHFPRIHTFILAEEQRSEVQRLNPTLRDRTADKTFRVEFAARLDDVDAILDRRRRELQIDDLIDLPYDDVLRQHTNFVPQDWILNDVRAFLASSEGGYYVIATTAGFGKTALVAELLRTMPGDQPVAFHLIVRDRWDNLDRMFQSLSVQLAIGLGIPLSSNIPEREWHLVFKDILAKSRSPRGPFEPVVVVIDGLDEAFEAEDSLEDLRRIERLFPSASDLGHWGVKLIISSRPGSHLAWLKSGVRVCVTRPSPDDPRHRENIRRFVVGEAYRRGLTLRSEQVERLVEKSEGLFVYARLFFESIKPSVKNATERDERGGTFRNRLFGEWIATQWRRLLAKPANPPESRHVVFGLLASGREFTRRQWGALLSEASRWKQTRSTDAISMDICGYSPSKVEACFTTIAETQLDGLIVVPSDDSSSTTVRFAHCELRRIAEKVSRDFRIGGMTSLAFESKRFLAAFASPSESVNDKFVLDFALMNAGDDLLELAEIAEPSRRVDVLTFAIDSLTDLARIEAQVEYDLLGVSISQLDRARSLFGLWNASSPATWNADVAKYADRVADFHDFLSINREFLEDGGPSLLATLAANHIGKDHVAKAAKDLGIHPLLHRVHFMSDVSTNASKVCALAMRRNVCVSAHGDGSLNMWDLTNGKLLDSLDSHSKREISSIAISNDGGRLFSVVSPDSQDWVADKTSIVVTELNTSPKRVGAISGHNDSVISLAMQRTRGVLRSVSRDGTIRESLSTPTTPKSVERVRCCDSSILSLTKDGRGFFSWTKNGTFRLSNLDTADVFDLLDDVDGEVTSADVSDDWLTVIAAVGGKVMFWKRDFRHVKSKSGDVINWPASLQVGPAAVTAVTFGPVVLSPGDNTRIGIVANDRRQLYGWNIDSKETEYQEPMFSNATAFCVEDDNLLIGFADGHVEFRKLVLPK